MNEKPAGRDADGLPTSSPDGFDDGGGELMNARPRGAPNGKPDRKAEGGRCGSASLPS
jgi:hypothetical protein